MARRCALQFRDDGRPDWSDDVAGVLRAGAVRRPAAPRHDGRSRHRPEPVETRSFVDEMIEEIGRGIEETTGLIARRRREAGCASVRLQAHGRVDVRDHLLENVDARIEDEVLYVPGDAGFDLKDQVKSVITVVAKTHHYWQEHIANEDGESAARAQAKAMLRGENIAKMQLAS